MARGSCRAKEHPATDTHLRDAGVRIENHNPHHPFVLLFI